MLSKSLKNQKAFSLAELLVSIGILGVLMSVILFNYGSFNDNLALSSAVQEMAIAIRQTQTNALNVREVTAGSGQFTAAYGIYFNPNTSSNDYYVFADTNGDKKYTPGTGCGTVGTECIEHYALRNGVTITNICNPGCPASPNSVRSMHVTFVRPNPDASINFANNGGNIVSADNVTGKIVLTSLRGKVGTITIENTGQVYVQ